MSGLFPFIGPHQKTLEQLETAFYKPWEDIRENPRRRPGRRAAEPRRASPGSWASASALSCLSAQFALFWVTFLFGLALGSSLVWGLQDAGSVLDSSCLLCISCSSMQEREGGGGSSFGRFGFGNVSDVESGNRSGPSPAEVRTSRTRVTPLSQRPNPGPKSLSLGFVGLGF